MTSLPRFSVENPVLANLLMATMIIGGCYSALTIVREMFPESRPDRVQVTTLYPGATPGEVEKGITLKLEEKIKDVDGVEKIVSTVSEGNSSIIAELRSGYDDVDQAVTDTKAAIDTIPQEDFPEESRETAVARFEPRWPVISVALYGHVGDRELKDLGERLREDVLGLPGVTNVVLSGTRKDEISVEVRPEKLAEYDLSFMDVAQVIADSNLDLPAGLVRTERSNVAVRTLGEKDRGEEMRDFVVVSDREGAIVRLGDIAHIVDGFEDTDVAGRFNGAPAVNLTAYKTPEQDAIEIAAKVRTLVAGKMGRTLERSWSDKLLASLSGRDVIQEIYDEARANPYPPGVGVELHTDLSRFIEGRLELLTRNGFWGLVFVLLSLLIFLHWRVAFWVMMGLSLAIMGSLICMQFLGHTLNLITMFGLIIVLGLLVDDAIIVSEHVYTKMEAGEAPKEAAIAGTEEVTWPVVCAIMTTIVAFVPLMFIEGQLGDWMGTLPVIVCIALTVSLIEALTILPAHLAHGMKIVRPVDEEQAAHRSALKRTRVWLRGAQQRVIKGYLTDGYERLLRLATRYRYVFIAGLTAILFVCGGLVSGRHVPFQFLQKIDSDTLTAALRMEVGAPKESTQRAVERIEAAVLELPELKSVYSLIGIQISDEGVAEAPQSHMAQLFIELEGAENRERTSDDILMELREKTANIRGVERLKYGAMEGGPGGAPVHIEVTGKNLGQLIAVSEELKGILDGYKGVFDIVDDYDAGRREVQIELYESARPLGMTTRFLATQVRSAFYGFEARKVQRGREDVRIMVRYPPEHRQRIYDVESMRVATPTRQIVPFREVARMTEGTGPTTIRRIDQERAVTVTADVDDAVVESPDLVLDYVAKSFPELRSKYPGVAFAFGGQKLETMKSFGSLKQSAMAAIVLIFVILAGLFRSYIQPLIVLSVVPFGFIGAVLGHLAMGYPMTLLSMIGLVALTGIVVNDSMILVTFINRRVQDGTPMFEAVIEGGRARLRPILLTSVTTVLGIAPLLLEQSFQARFLIPMGISISAGLIFATVLTLGAVPCLYLIVADIKGFGQRTLSWLSGRPVPAPAG